jgi:hypothetical protein
MHHPSGVTHSDYGPFQTNWWRGCKNLPICLHEGKGSAAQKMCYPNACVKTWLSGGRKVYFNIFRNFYTLCCHIAPTMKAFEAHG